MPKFVWSITSRGTWAPQLFHNDDLPTYILAKHNAGRYIVHDIGPLPDTGVTLAQLSERFPAPAPEPREILVRIEREKRDAD